MNSSEEMTAGRCSGDNGLHREADPSETQALKVWALGQLPQHPLDTCQRCTVTGPALGVLNPNPDGAPDL